MASSKGNKNGAGAKRPRLTYFFLHGDLHRALEINRGKDRLVAWNYPKAKRSVYNYTDTLRFKEPAFKTKQVSEMLNRSRRGIEKAIIEQMVNRPQFVYTLDENKNMVQYMWHEDDILALLDYFASIPQGRPRKDGRFVAASDLPTPREVRAMIRHEGEMLGTMKDGKFIPTWRAR